MKREVRQGSAPPVYRPTFGTPKSALAAPPPVYKPNQPTQAKPSKPSIAPAPYRPPAQSAGSKSAHSFPAVYRPYPQGQSKPIDGQRPSNAVQRRVASNVANSGVVQRMEFLDKLKNLFSSPPVTPLTPPPPAAESSTSSAPGGAPVIPRILLREAEAANVKISECVGFVSIHSCAMLFAFGECGIVAFHWQGNKDSFDDLIKKIMPIYQIDIYEIGGNSDSRSKDADQLHYQVKIKNRECTSEKPRRLRTTMYTATNWKEGGSDFYFRFEGQGVKCYTPSGISFTSKPLGID